MLSVMRPEPSWNIAKVLCAIFDVTAGHKSPIVKQLETSVSREVAVWSDNWTMQEIMDVVAEFVQHYNSLAETQGEDY